MKRRKLNILYEDKDLIAVEKRQGLLTMGTDKEKEKTLFHELLLFQKQKNKNNKIFIVHRLDKDTSGIVLFAKNEKVKRMLQDKWCEVERNYVALVNGNVKGKTGVIESYLIETKSLLVFSTKDSKNGKYAKTEYEVIDKNDKYSLLNINIKTGRKNQIRVHLNDIGHNIVGDKKYGKKSNAPRMFLHANIVSFIHPITKTKVIIKSDIPKDFFVPFNKKVSNK